MEVLLLIFIILLFILLYHRNILHWYTVVLIAVLCWTLLHSYIVMYCNVQCCLILHYFIELAVILYNNALHVYHVRYCKPYWYLLIIVICTVLYFRDCIGLVGVGDSETINREYIKLYCTAVTVLHCTIKLYCTVM